MTYSELTQYIEKLKKADLECNLFNSKLDKPERFSDFGLLVVERDAAWKVYHCERGHATSEGTFYTQSDLYEYILCCYKRASDRNRWF